jgi:hypothetical protein
MAKKKTDAPKAESKAPAGKKPAKKAASAAPATDMPSINTSAAAAAAAAMVGNRLNLNSPAGGTPRPESSAFRALKEGVHKPASGGVGGLLGNLGGQKKTNQPSAFGKQVGRNQTFGADVNRTGVPRRTGG